MSEKTNITDDANIKTYNDLNYNEFVASTYDFMHIRYNAQLQSYIVKTLKTLASEQSQAEITEYLQPTHDNLQNEITPLQDTRDKLESEFIKLYSKLHGIDLSSLDYELQDDFSLLIRKILNNVDYVENEMLDFFHAILDMRNDYLTEKERILRTQNEALENYKSSLKYQIKLFEKNLQKIKEND